MFGLSRAEEFVRGLGTIAILEDDDFKRGIYDHIDGRAATHFLISPFLGLLGYNIFKMNEIRFGYVVDGIEVDVALFDNGGTLAAFRVLALNEKGRFESEAEAFVSDVSKGLAIGKIGAPLVVLTNGLDYRLYTIKDDQVELLSAFDLYELRRADTKTLSFVLSLLDRGSLIGAIDRPLFFNELLVKSKVGGLWKTEYVREALAKVLANPSEYLMDEIAQAIIEVHYDDKANTQLAADLASEYEASSFNLAELIVSAAIPTVEATPVHPVTYESPVSDEVSVETDVSTVAVEDVNEVSDEFATVRPYGDDTADSVTEVETENVVEDTDVKGAYPYGYAEGGVESTDEVQVTDVVEEVVEEVVEPPTVVVDPAARARDEEILRRDPLAAWKNMSNPVVKTPTVSENESDLDLGDDEEEIDLEDTPDTDPKNGVNLDNLLGL